jgi:hypothetical protein
MHDAYDINRLKAVNFTFRTVYIRKDRNQHTVKRRTSISKHSGVTGIGIHRLGVLFAIKLDVQQSLGICQTKSTGFPSPAVL